VFLELPRCDFI